MRRIIFIAVVAAMALGACVPKKPLYYPAYRWVVDRDRIPFERPPVDEKAVELEAIDSQMYRQIEGLTTRSGAIGGTIEAVASGSRQEALDVNNFDETADSTWFTNRIGRNDMTSAEIVGAIGKGDPPDVSRPILITSAKTEGAAPRLIAKDARGRRFMVMFEPPGLGGIALGAEMMSAMVLAAAGYYVPPYHLVEIDTGRLALAEGAKTRGKYGKMRALTGEDLGKIVEKTTEGKGGRVRAIAIYFPPDRYIGPSSFGGRRYGDRNDRIPHQHRRGLRGYRMFCAWLNLTSPSDATTANVFRLVEDGKGYIEHYVYDFSSAFGGAGTWTKVPDPSEFEREGYGTAIANLFTVGLHTKEAGEKDEFGFLASGSFDPARWSPSVPNLAASNMTGRDAFWAARLIMRFTDEDIDAMVKKAGFEDRGVREYVARSLKARRDKIGEHAFDIVNPLDDFAAEGGGGAPSVSFRDLAVEHGLRKAGDTEYWYMLATRFGRAGLTPWQRTADTTVELDPDIIARMDPSRIYVLKVRTKRAGDERWSPSTDVYLQREGAGLKIWGLSRRYAQH